MAAVGSLRGLRGLGLLNLHQVYEGFGQCLPPGGQVSRDPTAERLLQQRGYDDYFPEDLRLVGSHDAEMARADMQTMVLDGGLESGFGSLAVEDPMLVSALDSIYSTAKVDFDHYLADKSDRLWEDEKSMEFKRLWGGDDIVDERSTSNPDTVANIDPSFNEISKPNAANASSSQHVEVIGWTAREVELASEVEKLNNMRFRNGTLLPLAQNLAHVELPGREGGAKQSDRDVASEWEIVNRDGGVESATKTEAHPLQGLRQVYNILDSILCRSQEASGGAESFRAENHFGLRGVPRAGKGGAASVSDLPDHKVAELLRGSLRYLEENYWQWLRQEVLPAMQAEGHVTLSGSGEAASGAGFKSIAVDVVRAWVQWFLGERPEHAEWEHAVEDRQLRAPLWPQVFFLLRTGHYEDALGLVERHSYQPTIKKALRAWVMSGGMQRIGLFDTDGDGLLDERLEQELDTEYCQQVLPSSDLWMRAVYSIVNERAAPPAAAAWAGPGTARDDVALDLRELPSMVGVQQATLRGLRAGQTADTRGRGWQLVWGHVQDLLWRHLIFVRPDGQARRFKLTPTLSEGGQLLSGGVQGRLAQLLALGDDASEGLAGMDGELPREVLRQAPYVKVMAELLSLRFENALAAMDQLSVTCPQTSAFPRQHADRPPANDPRSTEHGAGGGGGWGRIRHGVEAMHMALVMDVYGVLPRAGGDVCRGWGMPSLPDRIDAMLAMVAAPPADAQRTTAQGQRDHQLGPGSRALVLGVHYALALEPAEVSAAYRNAVSGRGSNDADAVDLAARLMMVAGPEAVQQLFESGAVFFPDRSRQALLLLSGCKRAGELYLELSPGHPMLPRAAAQSDRLVGSSGMLLMASEYQLMFDRLADLLSKHLLPLGESVPRKPHTAPPQQPATDATSSSSSSLRRDEALRHCLRVRDHIQRNGRLAPLSCGTTLVDWVEQSARNQEQVHAFFSLLVMAEAQELHAGGFHSEAFFLLVEGRPGNDTLGTHMALSYPQFVSTWSSRTFLPVLAGGSQLRSDDDLRRRGALLGEGLLPDVDLESVAARALQQIRTMDPDLAGAPLSKVKRHVYGTLLLAMRCLLSWKESSRDAGAWRLVRAQAAALDALFCHVSGVLHAPTSILLSFHQLHKAISQ